MNLVTATQIGYDCGMETLGEVMDNILFHSTMLFPYGLLKQEEFELIKEYNSFLKKFEVTDSLPIQTLADYLGTELLEEHYPEEAEIEEYPEDNNWENEV